MKDINAVPAEGFAIPPYHIEELRYGWHIVCNKNGFNCLTFPDKPGAVVCSKEDAEKICEKWNSC